MSAVLHSFKAQGTEAGLDFDVEFDPERRFHCLVGVNSVGKTHLIEHLARTLLYSHTMFAPQGAARFATLGQRSTLQAALGEMQMYLATHIERDGETIKSRGAKGNVTSLAGLPYELNIRTKKPVDRPLVFVGARERGHTPNIKREQIHLLGSRIERFLAAFNKTWRAMTGQMVHAEEPADWFVSRLLINPNFVIGNDNDQIAVLSTLRLLQQLDPVAFASILQANPRTGKLDPQLEYVDGGLYVAERPIDKLATGYVAILKIFQEIVAGYSGWAGVLPNMSPDKLLELDGVVFIDEIEAHLHPQWQARIVDVLKTAFPNTTFFVTTHSPLVVRQTEPGEALEILRDGDRVTSRRLGSPRDWYLADIYAEGFHVEVPPPGQDAPAGERPLSDVTLDFSNMVREFTTGSDASVREQALALHAEIDARLAPDDPRRRSLGLLRELLR